MFRGEGTRPVSADQLIVHQGTEFFIRKLEDLVDFMRGAEPVKEMQEGDAGLESCSLCDGREIVGFLDAARGEQCPTRLADSHHILMVAVNGEGVGCDSACCNMEDRAGEFTGDLVHVGDHQEQTLCCRKGGGECPGLKRAVDCTCCAAFGLHLNYERGGAP